MANEGLVRIAEILKAGEKEMGTLEAGAGSIKDVLVSVRKGLREAHSVANSMGMKGLVRTIVELDRYSARPSLSPEDLTAITFALSTLKSGLANGGKESVQGAILETLELLGIDPLEVMSVKEPTAPARKKPESSFMIKQVETAPPPPPPPPKPAEKPLAAPKPPAAAPPPPPPPAPKAEAVEVEPERVEHMERVAGCLGGKVTMGDEGSFQLELPKESMDKVMFLLSPMDARDEFAEKLAGDDTQMKEVIGSVKEFMASFADGNLEKAQEVLEELSSVGGGELFSEIGGIARGLHEALQGLASSLGEELEKMVTLDMPDSGNRLEHILQLTEEAASTTLDHAEAIQQRIHGDREKLARIERHLAMLKPMGDSAHTRMDETSQMIRELRDSIAKNSEDLSTILTSQSYQDLTGQVITKIVDFQHGLENKLIGLVKGFGSKTKKGKAIAKEKPEELYGPAHSKMEGAVHSQDDVDAILAQFGF